MPKITIPTPLRTYTNNQAHVHVNNTTNVSAVIASLVEQYPELRQHLFNGNQLREFVQVFINDEDMRFINLEPEPPPLLSHQPFDEHISFKTHISDTDILVSIHNVSLVDTDVIRIIPSITGGRDRD